jgi:hypothetical protein
VPGSFVGIVINCARSWIASLAEHGTGQTELRPALLCRQESEEARGWRRRGVLRCWAFSCGLGRRRPGLCRRIGAFSFIPTVLGFSPILSQRLLLPASHALALRWSRQGCRLLHTPPHRSGLEESPHPALALGHNGSKKEKEEDREMRPVGKTAPAAWSILFTYHNCNVRLKRERKLLSK